MNKKKGWVFPSKNRKTLKFKKWEMNCHVTLRLTPFPVWHLMTMVRAPSPNTYLNGPCCTIESKSLIQLSQFLCSVRRHLQLQSIRKNTVANETCSNRDIFFYFGLVCLFALSLSVHLHFRSAITTK